MKEEKYLNYLLQFDEDESKGNVLKKWLEYKPRLNKFAGTDLDVSIMAVISYCKELIEYKPDYENLLDKINKQEGSTKKYEITLENSLKMRGDWLTSPLHVIKVYMGLLWETKRDNKEESKYTELFDRTTNKHLLYIPENVSQNWQEYCYDHAEIIWEVFNDFARDFVKNTICAGNFIAMPIYINPCRCHFTNDTLDTLLWKMYCCFKLKSEKNELELDKYLESAFRGRYSENAIVNVKKWMELYNNSWDDFVKYNFLSDAVFYDGMHFERPFDLRKRIDGSDENDASRVIEIGEGTDYHPMPSDFEECKMMMKNYNRIVEKRSENVFKCIVK